MRDNGDLKKISLALDIENEIEKPEVRGLYLIVSLLGALGREINGHPNLVSNSKLVLETYYLCRFIKEKSSIERKKNDFAEIVREDVKNSIIAINKFVFKRKKFLRRFFSPREENVKFGERSIIRLNDVYKNVFNYINSRTVKSLKDFVEGKDLGKNDKLFALDGLFKLVKEVLEKYEVNVLAELAEKHVLSYTLKIVDILKSVKLTPIKRSLIIDALFEFINRLAPCECLSRIVIHFMEKILSGRRGDKILIGNIITNLLNYIEDPCEKVWPLTISNFEDTLNNYMKLCFSYKDILIITQIIKIIGLEMFLCTLKDLFWKTTMHLEGYQELDDLFVKKLVKTAMFTVNLNLSAESAVLLFDLLNSFNSSGFINFEKESLIDFIRKKYSFPLMNFNLGNIVAKDKSANTKRIRILLLLTSLVNKDDNIDSVIEVLRKKIDAIEPTLFNRLLISAEFELIRLISKLRKGDIVEDLDDSIKRVAQSFLAIKVRDIITEYYISILEKIAREVNLNKKTLLHLCELLIVLKKGHVISRFRGHKMEKKMLNLINKNLMEECQKIGMETHEVYRILKDSEGDFLNNFLF
ncbi:MAG: hypothetical protein ACP6IP_04435 [Candidatus Njordarchaeia archaeon]